jgi:mono/diheme cytochrome c family protein
MAGCASAPAETPVPPPPTDGPVAPVYTAAQARRGQAVFTNVCATCHARNEFTGPIFELTWRGEPLAGIFEHISTNMPQDRPGSLTPEQYIDVVSYILELNGIPPGAQELAPDLVLLVRTEW